MSDRELLNAIWGIIHDPKLNSVEVYARVLRLMEKEDFNDDE